MKNSATLSATCPTRPACPLSGVDRWVGLRSLPEGQSYLCYVQDGVLLDPVAVDTHFPGSVSVLARSSAAVDLGLLQVVRDDRFTADLEWFKAEELRLGATCLPIVHSVSDMERMGVPQHMRDVWRPLLTHGV